MNTPTFAELYTAILADLKNRLGLTSIVGRAVLIAFATVQAAKLKLIYLSASFIYKNIFVDTADPASLGGTLERFGLVKLGRLPFPAIAGEYTVEVTGQIGAVIALNTTFKSLDTSKSPDKLFVLDTAFTFVGTTGLIVLRAMELGVDSSLEVGDELQVTAPIANVDSYGIVTVIDTAPTSAETIEDYRLKVIEAYRAEPQGGARIDYRIWAADAEGVRTVYPYVTDGAPGELDIFIEAYPEDSEDGYGTPGAAIINDVEDVIELDPDDTKPMSERGRRPLGIFDIHYYAITPLAVNVSITNLSAAELIPTIKAALEEMVYDIRPFIAGADDPNDIQKDKLYISDVYNVVREVIGGSNTFDDIEMTVDGDIVNQYRFLNGDIPYIDQVINV
jgi:uncharacterized phage protein gp47/JayE